MDNVQGQKAQVDFNVLHQVCNIARCIHSALRDHGDPCKPALSYLKVGPHCSLHNAIISAERTFMPGQPDASSNSRLPSDIVAPDYIVLLYLTDYGLKQCGIKVLLKNNSRAKDGPCDCMCSTEEVQVKIGIVTMQEAEQRRQAAEVSDALLSEVLDGRRPRGRGLAIATGQRNDFRRLLTSPPYVTLTAGLCKEGNQPCQ